MRPGDPSGLRHRLRRQGETMLIRPLALTTLFAAALLASCGDKSGSSPSASASASASGDKAKAGGGKIASCNLIKTESLCREYGSKNIESGGEDFIKGLCTGGEYKL